MSTTRAAYGTHELARVLRVEPAETCPTSPRELAESIVDALVTRETVTGEGPYFWLDGDAEDILNDGHAVVTVSWAASVRDAGDEPGSSVGTC